MKKKKGTILIFAGSLLIAAALFLQCYNLWEQSRAQRLADTALAVLETEISQDDSAVVLPSPDMEMPTVNIDGFDYIGILEIPCLALSLPVMSEWSYPRLKKAPCRYMGSAYRGDMILAAHNYKGHFGLLKNIPMGETVIFTDADGNVFCYTVSAAEILAGTAVEEMEAGEWDLSLFTCTKGGRTRFVLRCDLTRADAGEYSGSLNIQ